MPHKTLWVHMPPVPPAPPPMTKEYDNQLGCLQVSPTFWSCDTAVSTLWDIHRSGYIWHACFDDRSFDIVVTHHWPMILTNSSPNCSEVWPLPSFCVRNALQGDTLHDTTVTSTTLVAVNLFLLPEQCSSIDYTISQDYSSLMMTHTMYQVTTHFTSKYMYSGWNCWQMVP